MAHLHTPPKWENGACNIAEHDPESVDIQFGGYVLRLEIDEAHNLYKQLKAWLTVRGEVA